MAGDWRSYRCPFSIATSFYWKLYANVIMFVSFAACWWITQCTLVSSTIKTQYHCIIEILFRAFLIYFSLFIVEFLCMIKNNKYRISMNTIKHLLNDCMSKLNLDHEWRTYMTSQSLTFIIFTLVSGEFSLCSFLKSIKNKSSPHPVSLQFIWTKRRIFFRY
jgi:hypothetical protein